MFFVVVVLSVSSLAWICACNIISMDFVCIFISMDFVSASSSAWTLHLYKMSHCQHRFCTSSAWILHLSYSASLLNKQVVPSQSVSSLLTVWIQWCTCIGIIHQNERHTYSLFKHFSEPGSEIHATFDGFIQSSCRQTDWRYLNKHHNHIYSVHWLQVCSSWRNFHTFVNK